MLKCVNSHFSAACSQGENIDNLFLTLHKNSAFVVETIRSVILTFVFVLHTSNHLNCVITLIVQLLLLCNMGSSVQVVVLGDQTKGDIFIFHT